MAGLYGFGSAETAAMARGREIGPTLMPPRNTLAPLT